jgi:hypothetical protein
MTGLRAGSKYSFRSRELAAHTTGCGGVGNMYFDGPSLASLAEKEIEELDEPGHSSQMHAPGLYVFTTSCTLTCKKPDKIFDIPFFGYYVRLGSYANLTPGRSPHSNGAVKPHTAHQGSGAHARRLPYLQHRLRGLFRGVGGGSI